MRRRHCTHGRFRSRGVSRWCDVKARSIALAFTLPFLPITAYAAIVDCSVKLDYRTTTYGSYMCVINDNYPRFAEVIDASERWNSRCWTGDTMPSLLTGGCGSGDVQLHISYKAGRSTTSTGSCGEYEPRAAGANTGGDIILFERDIFDRPCSTVAIGTIMHELGHALGLADARQTSCIGRVMGTPNSTYIPEIETDDCDAVERLWTTEREQENYCNSRCWTTCDGTTCPPTPVTTGGSPILIDLDNDGFDLSSAAGGVTFDIDADGTPDRISWTKAATGDAFLVLDRNGNGTIDDGRELFGNFTRLQSGEAAANGYEALAEYDELGVDGNGDSLISAGDAIWPFLAVWTDHNHDGVSQRDEIQSVSSSRIVSIETKYTRSNRHDEHGNVFRFKSKASVLDQHGRPHPETTYDVFFVKHDKQGR